MKICLAAITATCLLQTLDAAVVVRPTPAKREVTIQTVTVTAPCTMCVSSSASGTDAKAEPTALTVESVDPTPIEPTELTTPTEPSATATATATPEPSEPEPSSTPSSTPSTTVVVQFPSFTIYDIWSTKTVVWAPPPVTTTTKPPEPWVSVPEILSLGCHKMIPELKSKYHCPGY